MRTKKTTLLVTILILFLLVSGCGLSPEDVAATETQIEIDNEATKAAMATDTPIPSATPPPTDTPTATPNKTATAAVQATDEAASMVELIESLYADDYISTTSGNYFKLPDYTDSLAQINWIQPVPIDQVASDFVLKVDVSWEMASSSGNFHSAGCGLYWGLSQDSNNLYTAIPNLDGNVRLLVAQDSSPGLYSAGSGFYGRPDPTDGSLEFMVVVEDDTVRIFVDGERVFTRASQYELEGYLAYAISSGTNVSYGTRCTFENGELWKISQ